MTLFSISIQISSCTSKILFYFSPIPGTYLPFIVNIQEPTYHTQHLERICRCQALTHAAETSAWWTTAEGSSSPRIYQQTIQNTPNRSKTMYGTTGQQNYIQIIKHTTFQFFIMTKFIMYIQH